MGADRVLTISDLTQVQAELLALVVGEATLTVSLNETDEASGLWQLTAYFAGETQARAAARRLASLAGPRDIAITPLPEIDWVRRSLEGLAPVAAGRFFLHGSHDRVRRRVGGISLEIDAGTAFGTGHHATTIGCLLALDRLLKRSTPKRILDVGCGTGVLALAAARASRAPVIAGDIDPEAVAVTGTNARNNAAGPLITALAASGFRHPRIAAASPYDLIFANILARPLIALAGALAPCLAPAGTLVLSGLTCDQERAVRAAYRNRGLAPSPPIRLGNWATLVFTNAKRPGSSPGRCAGRGRSEA